MAPRLPPHLLGYDRAISIFSPDGRLLQVEYAITTVQRGATAIGITCKEGVAFIADKGPLATEKLVIPDSIEKVAMIDEHIGATMSGLLSDGRVLIQRAQEYAQHHRIVYGEPADVLSVVRVICDYKQLYTQFGGTRPFGVGLIISGIDRAGIRLFVTLPSGIFTSYKAQAIGEGADAVNSILDKEYKFDISLKEAVKLGIKALRKFLGPKFEPARVEIATIKVGGKFEEEEVEKYL